MYKQCFYILFIISTTMLGAGESTDDLLNEAITQSDVQTVYNLRLSLEERNKLEFYHISRQRLTQKLDETEKRTLLLTDRDERAAFLRECAQEHGAKPEDILINKMFCVKNIQNLTSNEQKLFSQEELDLLNSYNISE